MRCPHEPYVLVTAARNEVDFIESTMTSVTSQTILPIKWVIVSDGSIDGTDDVVRNFAARYSFIHLERIDDRSERSTAAKVRAIGTAIEMLEQTEYAYIGNLDADVTFEANYFETLLLRFESDPGLGVIGGRIFQVESSGDVRETRANTESVAGAIQFFRRECFEQVGGYRPLTRGMEDGIAEITARSLGWKTRSYRDLRVIHHRPVGTVGRSIYKVRFQSGLTEYLVGFDPLYHVIRALTRIVEKPYLVGATLVFSGYTWGWLSRKPKVIPPATIAFMRREQRVRLRAMLIGRRR
jgi:glycosyltransferase involved in cell wall biosynthesis